jgi:hypothetical protein
MPDRSKPEPDPEFELTDELATFFGDLHDSEINGEIGCSTTMFGAPS